jgi:lipooligosaccharide transport system ATP-binding protein
VPAVRISAVVMTHPRRMDAALALRARHPDLDLRLVVDPRPEEPPNALRTARAAWREIAAAATHHLVVQDDMLLVDGIGGLLARAAAAQPERVLSLFTEWGSRTSHAVRLGAIEGASWVPAIDPYAPSAAVLLPADVARDLSGYATEADEAGQPDDMVVLRYLDEYRLDNLVSVPNLAEHAPSDSLMGNDVVMGPRHSVLYARDVPGPVALDGPVSAATLVPHLLMFEGLSICHLRDPADGRRWDQVPTHEYLAGLGITFRQLLDRYGATVDEVDAHGALRSLVAEPVLFQVWLTAFAYGVAAGGLPGGGAGGLEERLEVPLVRQALRTFGPGALKRFVPRSLLERLPDLVDPLVRSALRAGLAVETAPLPGTVASAPPAAPVPPVIEARGLVKRYGTRTAVAGIDVEVRAGEAFGFLGPNGAGKSSTMHMLGAVSVPSEGMLRILGMDPVRQGPAIRARLGVCPQQDTLDTELTVTENLTVYARYFGMSRAAARAKAAQLLDFVRLTERAHSKVEPLSGGMKRRLTIARALVNDPDIVLLDEPTTGLDPQARHLVWDRLFRLKQQGVTLVLTTHYMDEAEQLCDRLVVMDGGRIVAEDSPAELIRRYAGREVVEVRFSGDVEGYAGKLDGVGERVETLPDRVLVYATHGEAAAAEVRERRLPATSVLVRRASLEDVFLRLTGRTLVD